MIDGVVEEELIEALIGIRELCARGCRYHGVRKGTWMKVRLDPTL